MGLNLTKLADWIGQTVVGLMVVAVLTALAPLWAAVAGAPGYVIYIATLVALAASLTIMQWLRAMVRSARRPAFLRLQIYGDSRFPTLINDQNIFRWFYLRNQIHMINRENGTKELIETVNLFIAFQNDVLVRTLEVASPDMTIPQYETKEYNQRFAIIAFSAALERGTLEIRAGY